MEKQSLEQVLPEDSSLVETDASQRPPVDRMTLVQWYWENVDKFDKSIRSFVGEIAVERLKIEKILDDLRDELLEQEWTEQKEFVQWGCRRACEIALEVLRAVVQTTDNSVTRNEFLAVLYRKSDAEAVEEVNRLWAEYKLSFQDKLLQRLYYFGHLQATHIVESIRREYEQENRPTEKQNLLQKLYFLGEKAAISQLLLRREKSFLSYIKKHCRDDPEKSCDVIQAFFLHMTRLQTRRKYDYRRPWLSWAYRVLHNRCVDCVRGNSMRPIVLSNELVEQASDNTDTEALVLQRELIERIKRAGKSLPDREKAILKYRLLDCLTFKEIGKLSGISTSTAKKLYDRACKRINEVLGDEKNAD